jgi:hypothetical protein
MPSRKKKKKGRTRKDIAPLYAEDIGTEGIKKTCMATPSTSSFHGSNFHLPLTKDEEHRRRKRMVSLRLSQESSSICKLILAFF